MSARASHASDFRVDVAIIGGGLAGIGCALALERTGLSVALFERSDTLGGRARSCHEATTGDVIDIGPHILLSEYHNMLDMLEHLGTREQVHWEQDRFITLLDGQQHLSMKLHRLPAPLHLVPSLLKVPALSLRDKLSNARMTWLALRASEQELLQLDQLNGAELLERCGVNARFRDWFWKTATLALLNIPLAECSAAALVRMYGQLIGVSAYRSGMPKRPLGDLFAPDAMQRLSACGTRIELNAEVRRIHAVDGRLKNLELMDGRRITPSLCVSAIPPQDLHKLVRSSRIADTAWARNLTRFDPCPYLSTYLWLDRKVTQDRFWSRIWSPDDLNSDFYDLSNIRADIEQSRSLIASNSIYSTQQSSMSDAEIIEKTRQELVDYAPSAREARVQHAVVHRIDMAIPCPRPGTETARPHTQTPLKGLLIAGDWTRTRLPACMESAVYSGRLAAEHVAAALAQPITAVLPLPHPDVSVRLLRALAPAGPSIERLITSTSRRASATRSARLD
ncbi:MAG: hydroxysqualene dehydroxylase HpnE [Povalibacter sp.]